MSARARNSCNLIEASILSKWTTASIPAQTGKTVILTGANSGIGYHTSLELARAGARVLLACRNQSKGEAALAQIHQQMPGAQVELALLDLASLASIRQFAANFLARGEKLDLLINNAGVMAFPQRRTTGDGFEAQFGTNHLGHFALTALLFPALLQAAAQSLELPRVLTVSSIAHKRGRMHFDDLQFTQQYNPWAAYQQSKLANLLFTWELNRRIHAGGLYVRAIAAHPGVAATNLFQSGPGEGRPGLRARVMRHLIGLVGQPEAQGALPVLYAATAPEVEDGGYYGPDRFFEFRGSPVRVTAESHAVDAAAAARLWQISEQLTGVKFVAL
jgi:NAD(P)-dependent dehydrogenase (short-subunit alcohol dehydrogenase family)